MPLRAACTASREWVILPQFPQSTFTHGHQAPEGIWLCQACSPPETPETCSPPETPETQRHEANLPGALRDARPHFPFMPWSWRWGQPTNQAPALAVRILGSDRHCTAASAATHRLLPTSDRPRWASLGRSCLCTWATHLTGGPVPPKHRGTRVCVCYWLWRMNTHRLGLCSPPLTPCCPG